MHAVGAEDQVCEGLQADGLGGDGWLLEAGLVSENQDSVACRTMPLPLAVGHCLQTCSPVNVVLQLGHCHARESRMVLLSLRCFCTAKLMFPSVHTCSSSKERPDTVKWSLARVHLKSVGLRTCNKVRY